MRRAIPKCTKTSPSRRTKRKPTICVVDPRSDDYQCWQATTEARELRLVFCASAEEALRLARTQAVDLWVLNMKLPGLSGTELCGMLKAQSANAAVFLVADEYSIEAERAAWHSRATMFGCKGAHAKWLDGWLRRKHGATMRSGHAVASV